VRREAGTGKRSSPSQNHTPHAVSILALRPESAPQLPSALASARVDLSLRPDLSRLLCCLGFSLGASRLVFSSESICKFCESAREQSPVRSVSMDSFCITRTRCDSGSHQDVILKMWENPNPCGTTFLYFGASWFLYAITCVGCFVNVCSSFNNFWNLL